MPLEFNVDAPGVLEVRTDVGGEPLTGCAAKPASPPPDPSYVGTWTVAADNFGGVTQAQVAQWVESSLGDSQSWGRAGIAFVQRADAQVTFQIVQEAANPIEGDLGDTLNPAGVPTDPPSPNGKPWVELELAHMLSQVYPGISYKNLVNHEAGHAYFGATHTGTGIMNDFSVNPPDFPTDSEIADTRVWLGI